MKALNTETILWTIRTISVELRQPVLATRNGAHFVGALTDVGQKLEVESARRAQPTSISPEVVAEHIAAQDASLRAVLAHLAVIDAAAEFGPSPHGPGASDARSLTGTLRGAFVRNRNSRRAHAVRAVEGGQARVSLAPLAESLGGLPEVGGQTVAARIAAYLEACDACAETLTRLHGERASAVNNINELRFEALRLLRGLRAAVRAEATVNPAVPADLERRLFAIADEDHGPRRARRVEPTAPAAPTSESDSAVG